MRPLKPFVVMKMRLTKAATMDQEGKRIAGAELLYDPRTNKGTGFTEQERDALQLRGLLPPRVFTLEQQTARIMNNFRRQTSDLDKYIFLGALQDRNETLFYRILLDHIEEMVPIIYTPTVGEACKQFADIFRRSRGLYVSAKDAGRVEELLRNWPERDVAVIVVTDGERILGLGDLGTNGMGIPIGKLALYTVCAGIAPERCLPVMLDVGTNNEELLRDPLYLGLAQKRISGSQYDSLVDEFIQATQSVFPKALIQFEDFANRNAIRLLEKYRDRICCFNDDIQGTAAVALAGVYSATRIQRTKLVDQTFLFLGAGSAATGIADLLVTAMCAEGLPEQQARRRCWLVDSTGLVVKGRDRLAPHKVAYAHDHEFLGDLLSAVRSLKPTALIGVSGQPKTFTRDVLEAMAAINDTPIVFALSNPTSKAECTAEEAYRWTNGQAVFAGGSPFPPVTVDGRTFVPGQGNNVYIFPGVGLGIMASGASRVTDQVFLSAARALADQVSDEHLAEGRLYPPLNSIRDVSIAVATSVMKVADRSGRLCKLPQRELEERLKALAYVPSY